MFVNNERFFQNADVNITYVFKFLNRATVTVKSLRTFNESVSKLLTGWVVLRLVVSLG